VPEENVPNPIQTHDQETIAVILRKKAEQLKATLPKNLAFPIAQNFWANVRARKLALIRLAAQSSESGTETSRANTQKALKTFIYADTSKVDVDLLRNMHSQQFGALQTAIRCQKPNAANRDFIFCLMQSREAGTVRSKNKSEVNMREHERERLARLDAYARASERHAKRRNQA